jgi:hypothetical protein
MQERRKVTRTRVLKGAKMLLGKSSVIDCVAQDLTNSGAGLQVPTTNDLPESLDLTLDAGQRLGGRVERGDYGRLNAHLKQTPSQLATDRG